MQLAVHDNAVVLQIAQELEGPLYDNLPFVEAVLDQPSLLLVGVGMEQDMVELHRWSYSKNDKGQPQKLPNVYNPLRLDIGPLGTNPAERSGGTAGLKRLAQAILQVNLQSPAN